MKLEWIYGREGEVSKDDEQVLEGLEPHSNLKSLTIIRYMGECCPSWLVFRKNGSPSASNFQPMNLLELKLIDCKKLKEWVVDVEPTIGVFPCLKELTIKGCDNLSNVPVMSRFSSLETLTIGQCGELTWIGDADGVLKIWRCRKLRSIPSVEAEGGITSSLQELEVVGCAKLREIEEGLLASSTCLRDVRIQHCPNLISIPSIQGCFSLKSLTLSICKRLTSLPSGLRTSTSLQKLSITDCYSLKSIPEDILSLGCLTRLKTLSLGPFSKEPEEFPGLTSIHHLHSSLQCLTLFGWQKLSSLPHQLQHLTSLEGLSIIGFNGLKALPEWLGNLSSLRSLWIHNCENLQHLPSMQRLSNLQTLRIYGSPRLNGNSAERSKISHIPKIYCILKEATEVS